MRSRRTSAHPTFPSNRGMTVEPQRGLLSLPIDEFTHIARFLNTRGLARLAASCRAVWDGIPLSLGPQVAGRVAGESEVAGGSVVAEFLLQLVLSRGGAVPQQLPPAWGGWVQYLLRRLGRYDDQRDRLVAAGGGGPHSAIVDKTGAVRICGSERYCPGLLGGAAGGYEVETDWYQVLASDEEDPASHIEMRTLTRVAGLIGVRVVAIAADTLGCYTLALSATGEVFSWGGGSAADSGALGQGDKLPRGVPTRVEALSGKGVCGLSACYSTSLAWTVAGRLFTWGQYFNFAPPSPPDEDNPNRVGVNKRDDAIVGQHLSPTLIQELEGKPVRCAAAGHLHIVAVLQNGQLYSWGPSGFSHGHGQTHGNVIVPTQVRKAGNMTAPI